MVHHSLIDQKKNQNRTNNVKNSQIIGFSLAQVNNIHK